MTVDASVPRSRWSAYASGIKVAVLSLCTFAVVIFALFVWWDVHNRRLPDDDLIEPEDVAPQAADVAGKAVELDPQPPVAAASPPRTVPAPAPAPPAGIAADLAARRLSLPVLGVTAEQLRDSFHEGRAGGSREHQAIDILAPRHTPVVAVEDGTIAKLFRSRYGGITIYQFDPGGRYCYYYAHLQGYAPGLREGGTVRRGQTIGFVGTTGNAPADTPHLHFQIYELGSARHWWEGRAINPYPYLAGR